MSETVGVKRVLSTPPLLTCLGALVSWTSIDQDIRILGGFGRCQIGKSNMTVIVLSIPYTLTVDITIIQGTESNNIQLSHSVLDSLCGHNLTCGLDNPISAS